MMSSTRRAAVDRVHVVAGVVANDAGRVLVAQRPADKSMTGAWEFPGGKLGPGEARQAGLAREFEEELGIRVETARPLIRYRHRYPELEVDLDVWRIERWHGKPHGREGQVIGWHRPQELMRLGLLPADAAVVGALLLPTLCAVSRPDPADDESCLDAIERLAGRPGVSLICLRRPDLDADALLALAAGAACRVEGTETRLLLHGDPAVLGPALRTSPRPMAARFAGAVAGLHIPARCLPGLVARPITEPWLFGVSCHDGAELEAAHTAGADYAFLGPVKPTPSHPGQPGLGWDKFSGLIKDLPLPVYAIGGLGPDDLETAWAAGAQGVAGISAFWPK